MDYISSAFKKYADFKSRATRSEFWYFTLFSLVGHIILGIVDWQVGTIFFSRAFALALFMPGWALGVRRMHDVGKSGWFVFIPIYSLILALTEGERRTNNYGPDPKDER